MPLLLVESLHKKEKSISEVFPGTNPLHCSLRDLCNNFRVLPITYGSRINRENIPTLHYHSAQTPEYPGGLCARPMPFMQSPGQSGWGISSQITHWSNSYSMLSLPFPMRDVCFKTLLSNFASNEFEVGGVRDNSLDKKFIFTPSEIYVVLFRIWVQNNCHFYENGSNSKAADGWQWYTV